MDLTATQQKTAAVALAAAFAQDPFMVYVFPNAKTRVQQLTKLFLPTIRCGLRYGGVEVAPEGNGALVWLSGQYFPLRWPQIIRSVLIWTPVAIGLPAFIRLEGHEIACEQELKKRAPEGFAYLWVLGVHPQAAGRGLGKQMMQSALQAMRSRGHSACLLRTDNEKNVPLYQHLGFQQIHTAVGPNSGLQYWVLSQDLM